MRTRIRSVWARYSSSVSLAAGSSSSAGLRDPLDHALEHGRRDVLLVLEVAVERAVADAELGRDVGDAGLVEAALGEDALGRVEDVLALAHAATVAGTPA